jgi:hypothetical protein
MQVSSATVPTPSTAASSPTATGIVAQVEQLRSVVSDGSTASTQDKVTAHVSVVKLMFTPGSGWSDHSTKADTAPFLPWRGAS